MSVLKTCFLFFPFFFFGKPPCGFGTFLSQITKSNVCFGCFPKNGKMLLSASSSSGVLSRFPVRSGADLEKIGGRCFGGGVEEGKDHLPDICFLGGGTSKLLKGLVVFFVFLILEEEDFFLEVHRKREGEEIVFIFLIEDIF